MVDSKSLTKEFTHGLVESYAGVFDECNNKTIGILTTTGWINISEMNGVAIGIKSDGNLTYDIEVSFDNNRNNVFKAKESGSLNNTSKVEVLTGWAFWVRVLANPSTTQKVLVQVGAYR